MIIAHKHKFIFIHIWRTGGNSIRNALQPYTQEINPPNKFSSIKRLFSQKENVNSETQKIEQHIKLKELQRLISPEVFNDYYKFAFVRNPLDLVVSHYHFISQKPNNHPQKELIRGFSNFKDYVKWSSEHEMKFLLQANFIFDEQGKKLADFTGRFEELQNSFNQISHKINIDPFQLERLNRSEHKGYLSYYNSETESLVRRELAEDFRLFSYP